MQKVVVTNSESRPKRKALIFLGAGASADADVPMTVGMLDKFREFLADSPKADEAQVLVDILKALSGSPIIRKGHARLDIEHVMRALDVLGDESGIPQAFFDGDLPASLKDPSRLEQLKTLLQGYIRQRCLPPAGDVAKLREFRRFMTFYDHLDVFTVNYDVVVELICELDRIPYSDGFQLVWDPTDFDRVNDSGVALHKLHGSAIWYESQLEGYLKVPLRFGSYEVERLSGTPASPFMMYPAQKWNDSEVMLELHKRFTVSMRDTSQQWMMVVGYSFRDDHLNNAILEAARANPGLHLLIVSPSAVQVFDDRLREQAVRPASATTGEMSPILEDRVVLLPFRYEPVLRDLAGGWYGQIQQAVSGFEQVRHQRTWGRVSNYAQLVMSLADAGDLDRAEAALEWLVGPKPDSNGWWSRALPERLNDDWPLLYNAKVSALAWTLGRKDRATMYWKRAQESLKAWFMDSLRAQVNATDKFFAVFYKSAEPEAQPQGGSMALEPLRDLTSFFGRYVTYTESDERHQWRDERQDWLDERHGFLHALLSYWDANAREPILLERRLRETARVHPEETSSVQSAVNSLPKGAGSLSPELKQSLEQAITHLERKMLYDLIGTFLEDPDVGSSPKVAN